MKRHVFGMQIPLVLAVTISCAVFPPVASANPGAVGEPRQEPSGFMDPVVERVRTAVQKEVGDSRFSVSIYNLPDAILLRGEVDSDQARSQIVSVAGRVSGKPVRDEMKLRPALTDDQIASSLRSALSQEYPQLADRVQVEVRGGVAYLSGDLRNHREIDELLSTALMINGVKDIQSDITLGGRPYGSGRMRVGRRAY